jgi:glycosyltransferase involved in cell wall biosynthesis
MRIALVSEHASPLATLGGADAGGQNVHVAALARGLARRGHDVTVYTRRDSPSLPNRIECRDGYAIEHVPAGPPSDLPKDELFEHMPAFAAWVADRWDTEVPDLVHAHFWMSGWAAVRAAAPLGVPVLQTFHALGTVKRRHQGAKDTSPTERLHAERELCARVDRVVATCSDEVTELRSMGLPAARATVVPCGVDSQVFAPGDPPRGGPPRLLAIGRLVERKGIGNVIRSLTELPGVLLTVAGGPAREALDADPEVARLRRLVERHGVTDRVEFVGSMPRDAVPALMRGSDVVVCAPWYEPFGIVPLEAMACGRPVVGTAVGGLLDTVVPGVTGDLVPPRRPDRLAEALRRLLEDPDRRAAYGRAGRARVLERYDWDNVVAATEQVYAEVLAGRKTGAGVLR